MKQWNEKQGQSLYSKHPSLDHVMETRGATNPLTEPAVRRFGCTRMSFVVMGPTLFALFGSLLLHTPKVTAMESETIIVLTYNLWHGLNPTIGLNLGEFEDPARRELRLRGFLNQARALDPDIVFLQEVNPAPELSRRIGRELGYDHTSQIDNGGIRVGAIGVPANLRSGLAILAKRGLGLRSLGGRKLSGPWGFCSSVVCFQTGELRFALAAEVTVKGQRLLLVNTHLHHGPALTQEAADALAGLVHEGKITPERAGEIAVTIGQASKRRSREISEAIAFAGECGADRKPTILAGDLNATPDTPEIQWLTETAQFHNVLSAVDTKEPAPTWDVERNGNIRFFSAFKPLHVFEPVVMDRLQPIFRSRSRRIDHILHRGVEGFLEVTSTGLFGETPHEGVLSSDHFGVWVELSQVAPPKSSDISDSLIAR